MADTDTLISQTVSHYRILEKLGVGGMGVVYKAERQNESSKQPWVMMTAEEEREGRA